MLIVHYVDMYISADSRFMSSRWETSLQCNAFSDWLSANPESALYMTPSIMIYQSPRIHGTRVLVPAMTVRRQHPVPRILGKLEFVVANVNSGFPVCCHRLIFLDISSENPIQIRFSGLIEWPLYSQLMCDHVILCRAALNCTHSMNES